MPPNKQNLKLNSERTPEERKALASKAGKASGEARRARRDMKQMLESVMTAANIDEAIAKRQEAKGFASDDNAHAVKIVTSILKKAEQGDLAATKMILELLYGKQDQNVNVNMSETKLTFYVPEKEDE